MTRHLLVQIFAATILVAATASAETPKEPEQTKKADPAGGRKAIPLSGKVTEVLTSGGYTYVNLSHDDTSTWVAFPTTPVKVGQELVLVPGYEMRNFTSKTLNRTFNLVIFSSGPAEKQAMDPNLFKAAHKGDVPMKQQAANQPAQPTKQQVPLLPGASMIPPHSPPPPKIPEIKVKKAAGSNAYTVKQLYDRRSSLDNKRVVVRGKVVKINPRILKQCWIHLQDGSGKPGKADSVLVTTTPSSNLKVPVVGDVVTATGTLHKDRDYGGGYRYAVILDNTEYRIDGPGKK
jgi:hypothetical protein